MSEREFVSGWKPGDKDVTATDRGVHFCSGEPSCSCPHCMSVRRYAYREVRDALADFKFEESEQGRFSRKLYKIIFDSLFGDNGIFEVKE